VRVRSEDPISLAGLQAQLGAGGGAQPGTIRVEPEPDGDSGPPDVVVIVGDTVNAWLLDQLASMPAGSAPHPVVVLGQLDDAAAMKIIESGGLSMLHRGESTAAVLHDVVCSAARGEARLPTDLLGSLLTQMGRTQRQVLAPRGLTILPLTPRQLTVLRMIAAGAETTAIARDLSYSERSIKNVVREINTRLGVRNRTQAVARAIRDGLI
jgi:DNA-binding NarL/FixJ family response regulator